MDTGENKDIISKYRDRMGLENLTIVFGDGELLKAYEVSKTSSKYAIDSGGILLYKGSGSFTEQQWEILFNALSENN